MSTQASSFDARSGANNIRFWQTLTFRGREVGSALDDQGTFWPISEAG
jgi:hypothetical protein